VQLWFVKAHHKIARRRKEELSEILGFFYNISATEIARRAKSAHGLGLGKLPKFGVPLQGLKLAISNLAYSLGLPLRPIIKSHK